MRAILNAETALRLRADLEHYLIERTPDGPRRALKPGHRSPFHWPPHPIAYEYHVLESDWGGATQVTLQGETFDVKVANTPLGVFGRIDALWVDARGDDEPGMIEALKKATTPLFARQIAIAECLGLPERFTGHIRDLDDLGQLKLLYCTDRDVANEARTEIELRASSGVFLPALVAVLEDQRHPFRRSAQWCVLDLFEDLPSFAKTPEEAYDAIRAMRDLLWDGEDDHARTVYKAGVVIGGHLPGEVGGPVLMQCLDAPSKVGRRSAMHGLFHVVEWEPRMREQVVAALRARAEIEPEPLLREFAVRMAADIESGGLDHVREPVFPDEE